MNFLYQFWFLTFFLKIHAKIWKKRKSKSGNVCLFKFKKKRKSQIAHQFSAKLENRKLAFLVPKLQIWFPSPIPIYPPSNSEDSRLSAAGLFPPSPLLLPHCIGSGRCWMRRGAASSGQRQMRFTFGFKLRNSNSKSRRIYEKDHRPPKLLQQKNFC